MLAQSPMNRLGRRYLLLDVLGKGGMGVVYHATDRLLNQEVALKRVLTDPQDIGLSSSYNLMDFRIALAQEFKLSASLHHPNIIEVLDYGFDEESQPYFTMELLKSPQTILHYGHAQPIETRLKLIVQMIQALAYLHRRGIIHRDLKPANVLVVQGIVKLVDFGLSAMHQNEGELGGLAVGTLAYMPPEVLMGKSSTIASDLYSLGIISYELLIGHHPFNIHDPTTLVNQIIHFVPDVYQFNVPEGVSNILARLLQKEPQDRFASADDVLESFNNAFSAVDIQETTAIRESFLKAARLVGRESEIRTLTDAMNEVQKSRGSIWLLAGESGVGKSRLIDELRTLALVRGIQVMRGQATNVGARPFEMWLTILRWLCLLSDTLNDEELAVLSFFVPDIYTLVGRAVNLSVAEVIQIDSAVERLLTVIQSILRRQTQPMLMLFEDLHWAGSESIRALQQLSKNLSDLPLMIVGTYRDDEYPTLYQQFPSATVLKLGRLPQDSIAQLSEAMLGDAGRRPQVVDLLQRETEGNVFFLIEVVRVLAEEVGRLDQIGQATLPERVFAGGMKTVIQRRLNRVNDAGRECLKLAALMGRFIDIQLLSALVSDISINWWLTDCANAAVLEAVEGQWRFTHDKLREGVLVDLPNGERRQLHERIAIGLETLYGASTAHFMALAHHWKEAENADKAEYYLTLSGEDELRNGAYQEAITFFEQALALIDKTHQSTTQKKQKRVVLLQKMGDAYLGIGDYAHAKDLYRDSLQLAELIGDDQGSARALGSLGDIAGVEGDFLVAQDYYERGLALYIRLKDYSGVAKTLNQLGDIAFELGEQEKAKQLYQESLNLAREIGDQWGMAGAYRTQEMPFVQANALEKDAETKLLNALYHYQQDNNRQGMADTLFNLALLAEESEKKTEAREYLNRCIQLRESLSDSSGLAQAYEKLASIEMAEGDNSHTQAALKKALLNAIESDNSTGAILITFAKFFIARKAYDRAIELLSYLIHAPDVHDKVQDVAEQLVFSIQDNLPSHELEANWEKGKIANLKLLFQRLLNE